MVVFCLSSLLSVFPPGCEQLHWKCILYFSEFLHVARGVLKQSNCKTFENLMLMKQAISNMLVDIIMSLDILRDNELASVSA